MSDDLPALLGGPPVRPEGPPQWPFPDNEVRDALLAAHADGSWGQYLGPNVGRLEEQLVKSFGVTQALTCSSGTLAVEIALRAIGVGPGDEVVLAGYEFEPSFLTIHALGAIPLLVDISSSGTCIDPARIAAAISPATKAILVSHLHGGLVRMSEVMAIARRAGVRVVEDAAQTPGATVDGKPAGSWGDIGTLSFGGSKLLTAGRGGAVLTDEPDLAQRARLALSRGIQHWAALSEIQAAMLIPQVKRLAERTIYRGQRVDELLNRLRDIPGLRPIAVGVPNSQAANYKLGFYFDEAAFGLSREQFVKAMRAEGMAFDAGFRALHIGRAASRYKAGAALTHAEIAGRSMVLLHHPVLSLGPPEIEQVAAAVRKTYRNAARLQ